MGQKEGVTEEPGLKDFVDREGKGGGEWGVRGERAMIKKSQTELRSDRRRL